MIDPKEKIAVYEALLHDIHYASSVTMNAERMQKILTAISEWSYAHRQGNGTFTDEEQTQLIEEKFHKLKQI